jgi:hypothetical protein
MDDKIKSGCLSDPAVRNPDKRSQMAIIITPEVIQKKRVFFFDLIILE